MERFASKVNSQIKSVSKVMAHFSFFVNIFRNFNAICDFFDMTSYGYKDNFKPKNLEIHWFFYRKMKTKNYPFTERFISTSQFKNVYEVTLWKKNGPGWKSLLKRKIQMGHIWHFRTSIRKNYAFYTGCYFVCLWSDAAYHVAFK